jgi:hypothetical protein
MTEVAPGVRFSDFDIFLTPALAFAIDFIWRTSSLVHSRRTIFLALAILTPVLVRRPCSTRHDDGNGMTKWRVYRCQQRRRAARPSASARGYGADWQALRASTPHTQRQVTTWTISRPGTLAVPMTQATSLGVAIGATRVRRPSTMVALATPVRPRKLFTKGRLTGWVHTSLKRQIGDFSQFLFSSTRPGLRPTSALLQNRRHLKFLNGWPPIVSTDTCWVRWRQVLHGLLLDPQNNNLPGVSSE